MTDQGARYDRIAVGYARWWAPVLVPAVTQLLDEIAPSIGPLAYGIDIGTGTGQLALEALARWPGVSIVGVDLSAGMCAFADAEASSRLAGSERERFRTVVAPADALPFPDAGFDAAMSSFVFQLVPRRARALREARRVLRPGGILAYVTWLEDDRVFLPDLLFDDVLEEVGIGARDGDGRSGDLPSVERAAGELRRAGFAGVVARGGRLDHRFTVDAYIAFLVEFDEDTLFADLDPEQRSRVVGALRARLAKLSNDEMTMRFPVVFASGRRSG